MSYYVYIRKNGSNLGWVTNDLQRRIYDTEQKAVRVYVQI